MTLRVLPRGLRPGDDERGRDRQVLELSNEIECLGSLPESRPRRRTRSSPAPSSDGSRFVAADRGGNLWIHETRSGRPSDPEGFARPRDRVVSSLLTSDARRLLTLDKGGTIAVWDVGTERCLRRIPAAISPFCGLAISPDAAWIAGYARGRGVMLWDAASNPARHLAREWTNDRVDIALSRDGVCSLRADFLLGPPASGTWSRVVPGGQPPRVIGGGLTPRRSLAMERCSPPAPVTEPSLFGT